MGRSRAQRARRSAIMLAIGCALVGGSTAGVITENYTSGDPHGIGEWLVTTIERVRMGSSPVNTPFQRHQLFRMRHWPLGEIEFEGDRVGVRPNLEVIPGPAHLGEPIETPTNIMPVVLSCDRTMNGAWGATSERVTHDLEAHAWMFVSAPGNKSVRGVEREGMRLIRDAVASMDASDRPKYLWIDDDLVQTGHADRVRIRWTGYAINVATVMGLASIGIGGWGVGRVWVEARRVRRGLCVRCTYDLRGIEGGVCPECGVVRDGANAQYAERAG